MPRQAVALFRSALIGALDLASDVNPQTKCPLRKKMHEAKHRVETNFTARGLLGSTPQALPTSRPDRRFLKPGSDLGKDANPPGSGPQGKESKFRHSSSIWKSASQSGLQPRIRQRSKTCYANSFSNSREAFRGSPAGRACAHRHRSRPKPADPTCLHSEPWGPAARAPASR